MVTSVTCVPPGILSMVASATVITLEASASVILEATCHVRGTAVNARYFVLSVCLYLWYALPLCFSISICLSTCVYLPSCIAS